MNHFRAIIKIALIVIYTGVTFSIYFLGYLLVRLLRQPTEAWRNLFMSVWAHGMAFILNVKIETRGNPPEAPFFLVSNHLSYLDIVPLFINLNCTFVAKKEVRSWPVLGFMVKSVGVIFIDRTKRSDVTRVNEILTRQMNDRQGIIIFPEGTSTGGRDVLSFKPSLLQFPAARQIPVHYATIYYETGPDDKPAEESVCFYGAREPFTTHVYKLVQTKKVTCIIEFGKQAVVENDRKALAEKLHNRVEKQFIPTTVDHKKVNTQKSVE